jgi:hypothetical protein
VPGMLVSLTHSFIHSYTHSLTQSGPGNEDFKSLNIAEESRKSFNTKAKPKRPDASQMKDSVASTTLTEKERRFLHAGRSRSSYSRGCYSNWHVFLCLQAPAAGTGGPARGRAA